MMRRFLTGCALTAACAAHAQTIPNSGELLQQTPPTNQPKPSSNPGLTIKQPGSRESDQSPPFFVQRIEITGNTWVSTAELRALVAPSENKTLNLQYLEQIAGLITKRYQDHGYLLSRAYVPAQTLDGGTVRIAVVEARYGVASVSSNTSKVDSSFLVPYLSALQPGQPVTETDLERSLLLLSDVPGAVVNSVLAPGTAVGTSDIRVTAEPGAPYDARIGLDNGGNRYTGRTRATGTLDLNNPFDHGDVFSLTGLTAGPDLDYGRLGYQSLVPDGMGTTLGAAVSGLYYALGDGLSALHAHGTAITEGLTLMQPFIRGVNGNLFAQAGVEERQLRDEVDVTDIHTDRRTTALTLTVAGDHRDASGIFNFNVAFDVGQVSFENQTARDLDAATARIDGTYAKLNFSAARLQTLTSSNSLYIALNGQLADKNLDSSEQFFLGGPNSVRAYDVGAVGGASGVLGSVEFRQNLPQSLPGAWQAIAFVDSGALRVYQDAFEPGRNTASLSGAGVGLNWSTKSGWAASGGVAAPIGGRPLLAGDEASMRLWVEIHKSFAPGGGAR
ncbi:MAG: ShlB/FhaC/HecB family hemolysin secretion/activation protein [Steroidobacteraceae bacterium]|jgi:hemolysin activation/secretion protein